jgi:hypothetical protein
MKLDHIYIISWFGRDPIRKKFRKEIHTKQLEWCKTNNLKVTVLAQEYDQEDYQPDVEYVHSDTFLRPCGARNVLMERFYNSDDDFAIFADNDTVLVDATRGAPNAFIEEMRNLPENWSEQIDFVAGVNPAIQAYTNELARPEYKTHSVFRRTNRFSGGFFILKNLKKQKDMELWFDDAGFTDSLNNIIPGEESDFCINLLMNKLNCFQNCKAIFNDMAGANRSTWANTTAERTGKVELAKFINSKYKRDLIAILNEEERTYTYVGYSLRTDKPTLNMRFSVDKNGSIKRLTEKNHTRITFFDLPHAMAITDIMKWIPENITDPTLLDIVIKNKDKSYRRLSNPRSRFDWGKLNHKHPLNLLVPLAGTDAEVPTTNNTFSQLFTW